MAGVVRCEAQLQMKGQSTHASTPPSSVVTQVVENTGFVHSCERKEPARLPKVVIWLRFHNHN